MVRPLSRGRKVVGDTFLILIVVRGFAPPTRGDKLSDLPREGHL